MKTMFARIEYDGVNTNKVLVKALQDELTFICGNGNAKIYEISDKIFKSPEKKKKHKKTNAFRTQLDNYKEKHITPIGEYEFAIGLNHRSNTYRLDVLEALTLLVRKVNELINREDK